MRLRLRRFPFFDFGNEVDQLANPFSPKYEFSKRNPDSCDGRLQLEWC